MISCLFDLFFLLAVKFSTHTSIWPARTTKVVGLWRPIYVLLKILIRLSAYVKANDFDTDDRIFPISYLAARSMVKKVGNLVDIELKPHDLRRHSATYASRSGTLREIVSRVVMRHADLSRRRDIWEKLMIPRLTGGLKRLMDSIDFMGGKYSSPLYRQKESSNWVSA